MHAHVHLAQALCMRRIHCPRLPYRPMKVWTRKGPWLQYSSLCETGMRGFRRVSSILSKRDSGRVYPSKRAL
jgi:hypothetical protein